MAAGSQAGWATASRPAKGLLQHLKALLPFKSIQRLLACRRWPASGEDELFRKVARRHELFWVRPLDR